MASTATATFLFCDLAGSTALQSRLGDDAADTVRRRVYAVLREAVAAHAGQEVKSTGDGLMVCFVRSVVDACACAVAMQRGVDLINRRDPLSAMGLRVGTSAGEAASDEGDWYGTPVVEAARLCAQARPGQTLAADVVRLLVGSRGGHTFENVGEVQLAGLSGSVVVHELRWERAPIEPVVPLPTVLLDDSTPFVGREAEQSVLEQAWSAASRGEPRIVLVTGPHGAGKSAFAARVARTFHARGATVLHAPCGETFDAPLPGVVEALRWYAASVPADTLADLGPAGGVLAALVPTMRLRVPQLSQVGAEVGGVETPALIDAVATWLAVAARDTPVVLVLDDVQFAAGFTIEMLRRVRSTPVRLLCVVLVADGVIDDAERLVLEGLATERLALGGLGVEDVGGLLDLAAGRPRDDSLAEVARALHEESAGHPAAVLEGIERLRDAGVLAHPAPSVDDVRRVLVSSCPYKGLEAYQRDDAALFFGREDVVAAALSRLATTRYAVLVGGSGSGKSSVLRAGVLAALGRGALPGSARWAVLVMSPGADPIRALTEGLATCLDDAAGEGSFGSDPDALIAATRQVTAASESRVVIAVDQLEELWTAGADTTARAVFLETLGLIAASEQCAVVVALRADFYGRVSEHPWLAALVAGGQVLVGPLGPPELRRAIEGPASVAGLELEPGLTDVLLQDVAGEPGALPLLSHALLETWRRRDGRKLTLNGYAAAGGVRGAIAETAESVFGGLSAERRETARRLLRRLTEPGEGTDDTRRRVGRHELAGIPEADAVIEALIGARLVTVTEDGLEVAHEALLREWPRLREWLDEDRDARRLQRHLRDTAQAWVTMGREPGELYRGTRLDTALAWADSNPADVAPIEREFLDAGRTRFEEETQRERRTNRRLRVALGGTAALFFAVVAVTAVALRARDDARDQAGRAQRDALAAQAGRLRAEARDATAAGEPVVALRLAVEAAHLEPSPASRSTLLAARQALPPELVGQLPLRTRFLAAGPDGMLAATTGRGIEVWDVGDRRLVATLDPGQVDDAAGRLAFSRDGRMLAVATGTRLRAWNVADWSVAGDVEVEARYVAFAAGGDVVAVGTGAPSKAGRAVLLATGSWQEVGGWDGAAGPVAVAADGRTVAFATPEGGVAIAPVGGGDPSDVGGFLADPADGALFVFLPDGALAVSTMTGGVRVDPAGQHAVPVVGSEEVLRGVDAEAGLFFGLGDLAVRIHDGRGEVAEVPVALRGTTFDYTALVVVAPGLLAAAADDGRVDLYAYGAASPVVSLPTVPRPDSLAAGAADTLVIDAENADAAGTEGFTVTRLSIAIDDRAAAPGATVGPWPGAGADYDNGGHWSGVLSPRGRFLAYPDPTSAAAAVLDLDRGVVLEDVPSPVSASAVAWSADERVMALATSEEVVVAKASGDRFEVVAHIPSASGEPVLALDAAGERLAVAGRRTDVERLEAEYSVFDTASGQRVEMFRAPPTDGMWPERVAFLPGGRLLSQTATDVELIDVAGGHIEIVTTGAHDPVRQFAASPDGRLLAATSGYDARVWSIEDATPLGAAFTADGVEIVSVAFDRDSRLLLLARSEPVADSTSAASRDPAGLQVWDLDADALARRACAIARGRLDAAERAKLLPGRGDEPPACPGEKAA